MKTTILLTILPVLLTSCITFCDCETSKNTEAKIPEASQFKELIDIETAIQTGRKEGKKVLLLFTGYACINSRKMEDRILTDPQVRAVLNESYSCFSAYVDDHTEDPVTHERVGKKFMRMQSENFNADTQPYFCIIDDKGKMLSEIGFTNSPEEFLDFLKEGLK